MGKSLKEGAAKWAIVDDTFGENGTTRLADYALKNKNLTTLVINSRRFGKTKSAEILLKKIRKHRVLRTLDLQRCSLGDDGATIVANNLPECLEVLILNNNEIGDEGVTELVKQLLHENNDEVQLRQLDLGWNRITIEAVRALCALIRKKDTLEVLKLDSCGIGLEGLKLFHDCLFSNTSLRVLSLDDPTVDHQATARVMSTIKELLTKNQRLHNAVEAATAKYHTRLEDLRVQYENADQDGDAAIEKLVETEMKLKDVETELEFALTELEKYEDHDAQVEDLNSQIQDLSSIVSVLKPTKTSLEKSVVDLKKTLADMQGEQKKVETDFREQIEKLKHDHNKALAEEQKKLRRQQAKVKEQEMNMTISHRKSLQRIIQQLTGHRIKDFGKFADTSWADYNIGVRLGKRVQLETTCQNEYEGACAAVYTASWKNAHRQRDDVHMAVKILLNYKLEEYTKFRDLFRAEYKIPELFTPHPHLIRIFHHFVTDISEDEVPADFPCATASPGSTVDGHYACRETTAVVLEYLSGGSLSRRVKTSSSIHWRTKILWMLQVTSAVHHIWKQEVAHRDIKMENILFAEDGRLVLTDYGEAINLRMHTPKFHCPAGTTGKGGTPALQTPEITLVSDGPEEVLNYEKFDIFGVGLLAYDMFKVDSGISDIKRTDYSLDQIQDISELPPPFQRIVKRYLHRDPEYRLSPPEAEAQLSCLLFCEEGVEQWDHAALNSTHAAENWLIKQLDAAMVDSREPYSFEMCRLRYLASVSPSELQSMVKSVRDLYC